MEPEAHTVIEWLGLYAAPTIGAIVGAIGAIAAAVAAYFAKRAVADSRQSVAHSISAQLLIHFQARYDELMHKRLHEIRAKRTKESGNLFFLAYWLLQLEQFQEFCNGYIPDATYKLWLLERRQDVSMEPVCGVSFSVGWEHAKERLPLPESFTEIMALAQTKDVGIDTVFAKAKTYQT